MEDEDDVEGVEFGACDRKRQADENGMEDDAKLEDENRRHLRHIVLHGLPFVLFEIMLDVFARMAQVVRAGGVATLGGGRGMRTEWFRGRFRGEIMGMREVAVSGCMVVTEGSEAHGH